MSKHFTHLLQRAGVEHRRIHDMRHTAATLLLQQGVSTRAVMEIFGHASITTTMNTYAHVMPTMMEDAMRSIDKQLLG